MIWRIALFASAMTVGLSASAQHAGTNPTEGDSATYAPDVLEAARRDYMPIRVCYDATPRRALDQIRTLTLVLAPDGSVRDVRIDPASSEIRRFRTCLAPILRSWHLPAPPSRASLQITYPFDELRHGVEQARH